MKILVTAGGTREYIDGVRYIGNCSSGQTGADLVDYLVAQGHEVTWVGAKSAVRPKQQIQSLVYETFDELASAMEESLSADHYDAVFQAAAVSDFKVSEVLLDGQSFIAGRGVKLPTSEEVHLILNKQPKLVSRIKDWSVNPDVLVVAFKLTNSKDPSVKQQAINKLIKQEVIDMVAHNDLNDITDCTHGFCLYQGADQSADCVNVHSMADKVIEKLEEKS